MHSLLPGASAALEGQDIDEQDIVYYVGPNVLALEKRFGFPPREFRLWLALHEVTHRAQFTGVPWLRPYFLSLVNEMLSHADPDPSKIYRAVGRIAEGLRTGRNPLQDGGVFTLFAAAIAGVVIALPHLALALQATESSALSGGRTLDDIRALGWLRGRSIVPGLLGNPTSLNHAFLTHDFESTTYLGAAAAVLAVVGLVTGLARRYRRYTSLGLGVLAALCLTLAAGPVTAVGSTLKRSRKSFTPPHAATGSFADSTTLLSAWRMSSHSRMAATP